MELFSASRLFLATQEKPERCPQPLSARKDGLLLLLSARKDGRKDGRVVPISAARIVAVGGGDIVANTCTDAAFSGSN